MNSKPTPQWAMIVILIITGAMLAVPLIVLFATAFDNN